MLEFLFGRKNVSHAVSIEGRTLPLVGKARETILETALREGVRFPNDCRVGGCGTCKCRLLEGRVHERTDKAYVLSREELEAGYVLACQSVPRGDVRVAVPSRIDAETHPVVITDGVIASRRVRTHDIVELTVHVETPLAYTAGQYARLTLPSISSGSRCYSFARAPSSDGPQRELLFYVREVPGGALSPALVRGREAGQRVRVEGPLGDLRLHEGTSPILAIAGGSGLAPIRAVLEDAMRQKTTRPVVVLFGARTEADLYDIDALHALGRSASSPFVVVPVLSHEPESSTYRGARGLVTSLIAAHATPSTQAYLCGPPPMVDACRAALAAASVRPDAVFADAFTDMRHVAQRVA